ncbi:MAG: 6-phosphofructokinase [Eubacteriales bacterium]|jgi:6-phosphofructokinase|nr:6-phosphofructokinase [Eubacteriales bacterium]
MYVLKGNAMVGQSGGPTAAINATLSGVIRGAFESDAIFNIYGAFNGIQGMLEGRYCTLNEIIKGEEDLCLLENTPAAVLGSCRVKLPDPEKSDTEYKKIFDLFRKLDIRYFFYIGGNDSMDTVAKLNAYAAVIKHDIRIIGVPKTIDNDLVGTDHTPGYGSAAKYIAVSIQEVIRDCAVYTVNAVTIVEIMGRDAGWLTAASALPRIITGAAPDLIYLPECTFDYEEFFTDINAALDKHPNVVIAVSEGIRFSDGSLVGASEQSGKTDAFGHKYLSGTGKALELAVKNRIGCKVRSVELNILQRCASHIASKTDIAESVRVGYESITAAVAGVSGQMMNIIRISDNPYKVITGHIDINKTANAIKKVPRHFINDRGNNVTDECAEYILPLIEGETNPMYRNGIPVHFTIEQ